MADPVRTTIVKAVATLISNTSYFIEVHRKRVDPFAIDQRPAAIVFNTAENLQVGPDGKPDRHLTIVIMAVVSTGDGNLDDELQLASAKIEAALENSGNLGGSIKKWSIEGVDFLTFEFAKPVAIGVIGLEIVYQRPNGNPYSA
jgi:hypothetical protein